MKLLFCERCADVFKLGFELKSCDCGHVKGKYINNTYAVTNGNGINLAIGNGSLMNAIADMQKIDPSDPKIDRHTYIDGAKIEYAWCRPNDGFGNPHSRVDKDL
jgi:hypothetical protein